jgi:hypothetical protein
LDIKDIDIVPLPNFEGFWDLQAEWSQEVFGNDAERGPIGALKHLSKEVDEVLENPKDLIEYADLLFLVFDATRRAGYDIWDLYYACMTKLAINKQRTWDKPTSDEPAEHVR